MERMASILRIDEDLNPSFAKENTYHVDWLNSSIGTHYLLCKTGDKFCILASSGSATTPIYKVGDQFRAFHDQSRRSFKHPFTVLEVVDAKDVATLGTKTTASGSAFTAELAFYTFK